MASPPTTHALAYWLGIACKQARERHAPEIPPEQLGLLLGRRPEPFYAFEQGKSIPRDLDEVLAAYAFFAGYQDPRKLVRDAVDLWANEGEAPSLPDNIVQAAYLLGLKTPPKQKTAT
jgi:hypothetical protein